MSSLKFESLKDDFEALSAQIDQTGISAGAIQRLNRILTSLESEGKIPKGFSESGYFYGKFQDLFSSLSARTV